MYQITVIRTIICAGVKKFILHLRWFYTWKWKNFKILKFSKTMKILWLVKKTMVYFIFSKKKWNLLFCQRNKVVFIENKKIFVVTLLATFPSSLLSPDLPKANKCIMQMLLWALSQGSCFREIWLWGTT